MHPGCHLGAFLLLHSLAHLQPGALHSLRRKNRLLPRSPLRPGRLQQLQQLGLPGAAGTGW